MITVQKEAEKIYFCLVTWLLILILIKKFLQVIGKELGFRYREINISLVFITHSYFSVPTEVRLNSAHYLIMKFHNKIELQSIANSHSPEVNQIILTIGTTLAAVNSLRLGKNLLQSLAVTDETKILDEKIKANQAQYNLDREAAKILYYHPVNWINKTIWIFDRQWFRI